MTVYLDENQIAELISREKHLPINYQYKFRPKPKRGHKESELVIKDGSSEFRIIIRQSIEDPFDFSAIFAYIIPKTNVVFRLRRYNGLSHEHTNALEKETFFGYHIHQATLHYQEYGLEPDEHAVPTDAYFDLASALECLLNDCNFIRPINTQLPLYDSGPQDEI